MFYLTKLEHGQRRYIKIDYTHPGFYRLANTKWGATAYSDEEWARSTVTWLGGEKAGFGLDEEE